ncbi:hypothetical protein PF005_g24120 [Phytophthora fragariae]|uniref:Uncharacterized protein n=1 Tax=Phytophthora fragariae TaxID=53985 RepID=A0A6A3W383_9STRA|nr:hypothetical protein PF005_g24120 [Phytophthora fragariae]
MVVAIGFFIIGSPRYVHIPSKDRTISTLLHLLKQSTRTSRNGTIVVTGALLLLFSLVLNIASAFSADAGSVGEALSRNRRYTYVGACCATTTFTLLQIIQITSDTFASKSSQLVGTGTASKDRLDTYVCTMQPALPKTLLPHTHVGDQQELLERLPVLLH